jgi:hypothetical protein
MLSMKKQACPSARFHDITQLAEEALKLRSYIDKDVSSGILT